MAQLVHRMSDHAAPESWVQLLLVAFILHFNNNNNNNCNDSISVVLTGSGRKLMDLVPVEPTSTTGIDQFWSESDQKNLTQLPAIWLIP
jgi:hypothetical protein